jgi:hypothetical protein
MSLNFDISTGAAFPSQAFAEINAKLDVIINKLDSISNDLTNILNAIPCNTLQQDFRNLIIVPLEAFYFSLKTLLQNLQSSNPDLLRSVRSQCHTIGFQVLHSHMRKFINERSVVFAQTCAYYKSSIINQWAVAVENAAALFVFAVKGCEQINNNYNSFFDFDRFNGEIVRSLNYYKTYRFPLEFIRDKQGFSSVIINILRTKSSQDSVAELESNYGYFKWHVIRYKVDKSGNHGWEFSKFAFWDRSDLSQATVCSAVHYIDPNILNASWMKALVSWCLPNLFPLNNHEIEINHSTHNAQANVGNTFNLNPGKSFSYIFGQDDGRHWIDTAGSSNSELRCAKRQYYTTCASLTKVYEPNQEFITGQSPIFPLP